MAIFDPFYITDLVRSSCFYTSITLLFFLSLITFQSRGATLKTIEVDGVELYYYYSGTGSDSCKGLLIFLHGAVSQFNFPKPTAVPLDNLLEQNEHFLKTFNKEGFDVIIPIAYNEYNWLEKKGEVFIQSIRKTYDGQYPRLFLSGFSDGGTGSYRMFYTQPENYDALIVFNGYPQLENFHRSVDYLQVRDRPVLFFSTRKDKRIPYEFLLVEYRRQKMVNAATYFILREGDHSFHAYDSADFRSGLSYLHPSISPPNANNEMYVYAPIDGLVIDGRIYQLYPFREKTGRQFGMNKTEYKGAETVFKTLGVLLRKGAAINISPTLLSKKELEQKEMIEFNYTYQGETHSILLNNYFVLKAW